MTTDVAQMKFAHQNHERDQGERVSVVDQPPKNQLPRQPFSGFVQVLETVEKC